MVAARHQDVVVSDVLVGCYSVTVAVKPATNADTAAPNWWFTAVYGPQEDRDKAIFLEELEAIRDACQGPWAVTGDFNLILNEEDKSNDRIDRANLRRFRRTVAALELQDLHLHGRAFTWSNERENPTLVRLDRVLVSMDWEELFPNAHLQGLGSDASDHCPLLLHKSNGVLAQVREDTVMRTWRRPDNHMDPLLRLDDMLRGMVKELQRWSSTRIGEIRSQLLMARELVLRLDTAQEQRQLSPEESEL